MTLVHPTRRRLRVLLATLVAGIALSARAQQAPVYTDDFQAYGANARPAGWIDMHAGELRTTPRGLFQTVIDPAGDPNGTNIVYGANAPTPAADGTSTGDFAIYQPIVFDSTGTFEVTGRILRMGDSARAGIALLSGYPDSDRYYLIAEDDGATPTLRLTGFGGTAAQAVLPVGTTDSHLSLAAGKWYRFRIGVLGNGASTVIRARFWLDGSPEPATYSIYGGDGSLSRLTSGRIGVFSGVKASGNTGTGNPHPGRRRAVEPPTTGSGNGGGNAAVSAMAAAGGTYIDDLDVRPIEAPPVAVDTTPPLIAFFEGGIELDSSRQVGFKRDAAIEIRVFDDSSVTTTATLDSAGYQSLTAVTSEGRHTIKVHAVDAAGNFSDAQLALLIDKTPPIVTVTESGQPFASGGLFNRTLTPQLDVKDISQTSTAAILDQQPFTFGTTISGEGKHILAVTVTDEVGWTTTVPVIGFTIDRTPPVITITSPAPGQTLDSPQVVVSGDADDAVSVKVNGVAAVIDPVTHKFTTPPIQIVEGDNTLVALGNDAAGNPGNATVHVRLDTLVPTVQILAPAPNACLDVAAIAVSGQVNGATSVQVSLQPGSASPVAATISGKTWSASLPVSAEGAYVVNVVASTASNRTTSAAVPVTIDRTKPVVQILEGGVPFTASLINRPVALVVRVDDADPQARLTATLDGVPYASGTVLSADKTYNLTVSATDCAGHTSDAKVAHFTIDRTPPALLSVTPTDSSTVGAAANVTGTVSPDTATVVEEGSGQSATVTNGGFAFNSLNIANGMNRFALILTDAAGNTTRVPYSFTVKGDAPDVAIIENGSAIVPNRVFGRAVTPVIRSSDPKATVTATMNGAPFTSGTTVSTDGAYTVAAHAADSFGHASDATTNFTISRTPPVVTILSPTEGAHVAGTSVAVHGTVTGDVAFLTVNGVNVAVGADGSFDATVSLDEGPNLIVAAAVSHANNSSAAQVDVIRDLVGLGIILVSPADNTLTNRPVTTVAGQVLTPASAQGLTINNAAASFDSTGAFQRTDFPLIEGDNAITAAVRGANGTTNQVTVHVHADFTPPVLALLESGQPLDDGKRLPASALITVTATDAGQPITPSVTIDGSTVTTPATVTAAGGHTVTAIARDLAGNESRIDRTFFIGAGGSAGCQLDSFDPADGSVVTATPVTLVGHTGGAAGVKVNGVPAVVSGDSFSASVELSVEGDNNVAITCTDASGSPTGSPVTIKLTRATGAPSVTLTTPDESSVTAAESISVAGTVSGASQVDVNGTLAPIASGGFTLPVVHLADGLNVIAARAMNAAGRSATASRRVTFLKNAPAVTITSPLNNFVAGAGQIRVSGTWTGLNPTSLTVTSSATGNAATVTTARSDTTGVFAAASVSLVAGTQTITAAGRDRLGRLASASITVTQTSGTPSISITDPGDNSLFPASAGATLTVRGTYSAATGSTIDVAGTAATIDAGTSTFSATVPFATQVDGGMNIVARVTDPTGASSFDTVRVTKLASAPSVSDSFPSAGAQGVDAAVLPLILFSAPMDHDSLVAAFRLENSTGTQVSGAARLDNDVLTFAPAVLLNAGELYTMRVAAGAKDLAGNALAANFASSFTIAATAPVTAPQLNAVASPVCASLITVSGTAPAGARIRIDLGTLTFNATANAMGAFTCDVPLSGRTGFQVARVRVVGSDGSLSPAAEAKFLVDCGAAVVSGATFDRSTNHLTIAFSKAILPSTATVGGAGSIQLRLDDGSFVAGTVAAASPATSLTITPAQDLTAKGFTLTVTTAITDPSGTPLGSAFTQAFPFGTPTPQPGDGSGFISGEVLDADSGRPLPGASVTIDVPVSAFLRAGRGPSSEQATISTVTDSRGRYTVQVPEGAHTLRIFGSGLTSAWRQIIVPAGAGVTPIAVRLSHIGVSGDGSMPLDHGGTGSHPITRAAELRLAAALPAPGTVSLTSLGAQSLPGLLPLAWSPLGAAQISTDAPSLAGATLTFTVPSAEIAAAAQTISAVRYYDDRDEWRVLVTVVNIGSDGKASFPVDGSGAFALVYADRRAGLTAPPAPIQGAPLVGVADVCASGSCPPLTTKVPFALDPPTVLPSEKSVGTLTVDGSGPAVFPSGTAVQAFIDEELTLADGSKISDPPFTTDLLLYRNLAGDTGLAELNIAPSARAAQVILDVGFENIQILPYPGRLDRGTLIGPEGGRVPGDQQVTVEIPTGATDTSLHATSASITDFTPFGSIAGFTVAGGFTLTLQADASGATTTTPVELTKPARATFTIPNTTSQLVLVEVLDDTSFGRIFRLAAEITSLGGGRYTTKAIDRARLPLDGIIREGRYLLLSANAGIAFATGVVRSGAGAPPIAGARVTTPTLGVADLSRGTGIFALPVPSAPAPAFSLVPSTLQAGDGVAFTNPTAPAAGDVVNIGDLTVVGQPPSVAVSLFTIQNGSPVETQADGATNVSLSTSIKATFTPGVSAGSVLPTSIAVVDDTTGAVVNGQATAQGNVAVVWNQPPGSNLQPNRHYTATLSPGVRGLNGAPLGRVVTAAFATVTQITTTDIHPEKIRISFPDANGHANVSGDAGAIPPNYIAVAVRRDRDFIERYQATADGQGKFAFPVGTGGDASDLVTFADTIDLQIINNAGSLVAILPLTPFVTDDGFGFVTQVGRQTRFTSPEGITVIVPAGAFDVPTIVRVNKADKAAYAGVPGFDQDLIFGGAVNVQFDGVAKQRLDVEIPVPAGANTAAPWYLGALCDSARGPRVMIVDLLRVNNGKFTTVFDASSSRSISVSSRNAGSNEVLTGVQAKNFLLGVERAGTFGSLGFVEAQVWVFMQGFNSAVDLFFNTNTSIFSAAYYMAEKGTVMVPVVANKPFIVTGVDPSSGLTSFTKNYGPLLPSDPGSAVTIPSPVDDDAGPYPVFTTPSRIERFDLLYDTLHDESIRNLIADFDGSVLKISNPTAPTDRLQDKTRVEALNIRTAERVSTNDFSAGAGLTLTTVKQGDRVMVFVAEHDVDPDSGITVVFNKPIDKTGDLASHFKLLSADPLATTPDFQEVSPQPTATTDSGDRRVLIALPAALQRGRLYRLVLKSDIQDTSTPSAGGPLTLAQTEGGTSPGDLYLDFGTRTPQGLLNTFNIPQGAIRDLAMTGNILLVSALDAGVLAYDATDPAKLGTVGPFAQIPPPFGGSGQNWALAVDQHNRIFTTAMSSTFGVVREYHVEELSATTPQKANGIVSWRPGINVGLPASTSQITVSDRPEATPRKLQVMTQDVTDPDKTFDQLTSGSSPTDLGGGWFKAQINVAPSADFKYLRQRVTVVNKTAGFRFSVDVRRSGIATLPIIGRSGDQFSIVRNMTTFGVVALFGYGVGIYDLNAINANSVRMGDVGSDLPYTPIDERVKVISGDYGGSCDWNPADQTPCDPAAQAALGKPCPIPDLHTSPEAAISPATNGDLTIYALDQNRGVLQLHVTPPELGPAGVSAGVNGPTCSRGASLVLTQRINTNSGTKWFGHPRLNKLRKLFNDKVGRDPTGRMLSIATFMRDGARYDLVAANEYGLIVLKPLDTAFGPGALVDVVWIPAGAVSVRVLDGDALATVVDNNGQVLLVDLKNVGKETLPPGPPCTDIDCVWDLFTIPTHAIAGANAGPNQWGADDPRIVWKTKYDPADPNGPPVIGTLAPLVDAENGFIYTGNVLGTRMHTISAIDPHLRVVEDVGASSGALSEVDRVVPLGVTPDKSALAATPTATASAAVFRLELSLPGSVIDALPGNNLRLAVESEVVIGGLAPQTPVGFPRAHLRQKTPGGTTDPHAATNFVLNRSVPTAPGDADVQKLRYQRGYNRLVSPWVVALSDPRGAKSYVWSYPAGVGTDAQKKDYRDKQGCHSCERPKYLQTKDEPDVFEIYTAGRYLHLRPESAFDATTYKYLGQKARLEARVTTIMADTIHAPDFACAALNPPVAAGLLQETTYLHSGELATSAVDLDADGRAGWNLLISRGYRSRTIGPSLLGLGWDSPLFARLRPLPNGDVEYRDGSGEIWLFTHVASGGYTSPPGLYLKLMAGPNGWQMFDERSNYIYFDAFGRLLARSDGFVDPGKIFESSVKGNVIRYLYNNTSQLKKIIDPVGRETTLDYYDDTTPSVGLLKEIADSRSRKVTFDYTGGVLTMVHLPEAAKASTAPASTDLTSGNRPRIKYAYSAVTGTASFNDKLELTGNLESITDPAEAAGANGGKARVQFTYTGDLIHEQIWPCADVTSSGACTSRTATFTYNSPTSVDVLDILGQSRHYDLATFADNLVHIKQVTLANVPVIDEAGPAALPAKALPTLTAVPKTFTTTFGYNDQGQATTINQPDLTQISTTFDKPAGWGSSPSGGQAAWKVPIWSVAGRDTLQLRTDFRYSNKGIDQNSAVLDQIGKSYQDAIPAVSPDDAFRHMEQPHRDRRLTVEPVAAGNSGSSNAFSNVTRADDSGIPVERRQYAAPPSDQTGSTALPTADSKRTEDRTVYDVTETNQIARGRYHLVQLKDTDGATLLRDFSFLYSGLGSGGEQTETLDDQRNVTTTVQRDSAGRTIDITVKKSSGSSGISSHEVFGYDASGHLLYHSRVQDGLGTVKETFTYDPLGRALTASIDHANVEGTDTQVQTSTDYSLSNHTTTVTHPPDNDGDSAKTVAETDALGRTKRVETTADSVPGTKSLFGYDYHGVLSYLTDGNRLATLIQHDALGRETDRVASDGTKHHTIWNAWGQVLEEKSFDSGNNLTAHLKHDYLPDGQPARVNHQMEVGTSAVPGVALSIMSNWGTAGEWSESAVGHAASIDDFPDTTLRRTTRKWFDNAGRVYWTDQKNPDGVDSFRQALVIGWDGDLPERVTDSHPMRTGASFTSTTTYDALGHVTEVDEPGGYKSITSLDQAGNPTSVTPAGLGQETATYDSRGLPLVVRPPTGGTIKNEYDAMGGLTQRIDESGATNTTSYTRDPLGRVTRVDYPDSTFEQTTYENATGVVLATRDRASQWLSFKYDAGGRVTEVHLGPDPAALNSLFTRYDYDLAGRLVRAANKDAAVTYGDYDLLGHPRSTQAFRYANGTGLNDTAAVVSDVHTQGHVWTVFGERSRWRMPAAGPVLPATETTGSWRTWIDESRDDAGNLTRQRAVATQTGPAAGPTITATVPFGAGEPGSSTRDLDGGGSIVSSYTYNDIGIALPAALSSASSTLASPEGTGRLLQVSTEHGSAVVAGSTMYPDLSKRVGAQLDLALGERGSRFGYDVRGRMDHSKLHLSSQNNGLATTTTGASVEVYSTADFHKSEASLMGLTPAQHATLGQTASLAVEPPVWSATETTAAHQIDVRSLMLDGSVSEARTYQFADGRRKSDGVWTSNYDELGRLVKLENDPSLMPHRRIVATYDPRNRLAGRTAYHQEGATWVLDTAPSDGLPPDVTFLWDPIADRLVGIVEAGRSVETDALADAGLLRQYVHGDQGYDDPVEVLVAQGSTVKRYLPVVDEAGTGSIEAVLDGSTGNVVERVLYGDAYGGTPKYLQGPVVDQITLKVEKGADGQVKTVTVEGHLSERIVESSATDGLRLRTLTSSGGVAATAPGSPTFTTTKPYTLHWELTGDDWNTLRTASGAATLEIAVPDTLRAQGWGSTPPGPPPQWTATLYTARSNPGEPVAVRRPLATIQTFIDGIAAGESDTYPNLYEIKNLYLAASSTSKTNLLTGFHALPFVDPATLLTYARARWYDPATGTWLTPDPMGYHDSSTMYAFAGGDPVNGRDPNGLASAALMNPNGGESRSQYVNRLVASGDVDPMDAAMAGECQFSNQCGSKELTEISKQVTAHVNAEVRLIARMEVAGIAAAATGGLATAGLGALTAGSVLEGGTLLSLTVGGAAGGYGAQAADDAMNGHLSSAADYAQAGLEGIAFSYLFGGLERVGGAGRPAWELRTAPTITIAQARAQASRLRADFAIRNNTKNIAFVDGRIDGIDFAAPAISGESYFEGTISSPVDSDRLLPVYQAQPFRTNAVDSEMKLLEWAGTNISRNSRGSVTILTEMTPCEKGCKFSIKDFEALFPNVKVNIEVIDVQPKAVPNGGR